jgi:hypothetical protein
LTTGQGQATVIEQWRASPDVNWVRFIADDRPAVLLAAANELLAEFSRSQDEALGVAAVLAAQALVVARLGREQELAFDPPALGGAIAASEGRPA